MAPSAQASSSGRDGQLKTEWAQFVGADTSTFMDATTIDENLARKGSGTRSAARICVSSRPR
jgi:hypothetical protein